MGTSLATSRRNSRISRCSAMEIRQEPAIGDMLEAYREIKELKSGLPDLEFCYHYDMKSFFNYFNFLNVSKVAERAGINPSLMRKYTSGVAKAGQKQYDKLSAAVKEFSEELQAAAF